jgi:predicted helicase
MKKTIGDILEYFLEEAEGNRNLGDTFERLIAAYLSNDPCLANLYSDVWLWKKCPVMVTEAACCGSSNRFRNCGIT